MKQIVLTCVSCGAIETVDDTPENKRSKKCDCGAPMVERRPPGDCTTIPTR